MKSDGEVVREEWVDFEIDMIRRLNIDICG